MNSFTYYNPARILLGIDALDYMEELFREYHVTSLLFIYSGDFIKELGIWDKVHDVCKANGIRFYEDGGVVPNPKVELVRKLIQNGEEQQVDFILAAGGGSAIDTAKAVGVGIPYHGDVWDFFANRAIPKTAIPVGVISTLPASGSESSNCSIISNGLHKCGIEYDCLIPKFAIMNPQFTKTLPAYQTACGLADILSHMLERYFTNTTKVDATDYMLEGTIQALMLNAHRLMMNPHDIDARAEVQCLAFLAHNNILDIGRETDWGAHRIEHEISAQYGITHGEGMAVVTIAWATYMTKYHPHKLAQLANRIYGVDYAVYTETEMAQILTDRLQAFFKSLHLRTTLTEMEITDEHFNDMAMRATKQGTETVGHYVPLDQEKFIKILNLAL